MARKTLRELIRNVFGGNKGGSKKSAPKPRQNRDARSEVVSSNAYTSPRRAMLNALRGNDTEKPAYKSMADATKSTSKDKGLAAAIDKASAPDPKEAARKASQERARKKLETLKKDRAELNAATNNRYNTKQSDKKEAQLARQRIKSGEMAADPTVARVEFEQHPVASLAGRKFAQGMSFGLADLAEEKLAGDRYKESIDLYKKAEEEHPWVAGLSELAGGFVGFGSTAGATERLGAKVMSKAAPKAAERLAEKKVVQGLAKRGVNKAVKKGLVSEATEELIKQTSKEKAAKIVSALGNDIVQNLTTGAVYDIANASKDNEIGSPEWWKSLGTSAALNFAITGGIAGASALGGNKKAAVEAAKNLAKDSGIADVAARRMLRNNLTVQGKAKPLARSADEAVEAVARNVDEVAETTAKGTRPAADNLKPREAMEDIPFTNERGEPITGARREATPVSADRDVHEVLRDKDVPLADKEAALDARVEELDKALENAGDRMNDARLAPEVREAAQREYDEITAEIKQLSDEYNTAKSSVEGRSGYAQTGDDDVFPVDNLEETRRNDARSQAEQRAEEVMREEPRYSEEAPRAEAEARAEEPEVTQGQKDARKAWEEAHGQKFEKDGTPASDDQILDALEKYNKSQGQSAARKLSKAASSQVRVSDTDAAKIINQMMDEGAYEYDVVHQKDMYEEVANDLKDDWDRWIDKLSDIAEGGDWSGKEATKLLYMSQYLSEITNATASAEQDALAQTAWKCIQKLSSSAGQTLNGRRAYANMSRAGRMESALDDIVSILDTSIGFNQKHRKAMLGLNGWEKEAYIKGQLLGDKEIRDCLKQLGNAPDLDTISEAYTRLFLEVNKKNPKSVFDVVQELRYLNMLGNPKTHIRNVFGSAFFSPMRSISNMIRSGIEDKIAKDAGLEITKHGGLSLSAAIEAGAKEPKTEAGKAAFEAFESIKKDLLGSAKYDTPAYAGRGKTLAGKVVDKLSDFNSNLLTKEDDFFKSRAFKENYIKSYNKYLKDNVPITDKIKKQITAEALEEAQIATFNEYNEFAKWLSKFQRNAADANASLGARWTGRAVNAVMPFTKVPANLGKQTINYSPIGIAKGFAGIKNAARKGDAKALNKAIDELASGLTGTTIFGLGMLLGKTTDLFTTNPGKNDPAAKFKKQQGVQNYSITFKDPITKETHSYTLDWLVPTSATFFAGVEAANQMKRGDFDIMDIGGDWATVMSRLAEPVMETSMLSGLHGMLETMRNGQGDDDALGSLAVLSREIAQSWINSLVPTAAGQIARTLYTTDKMVSGVDDKDYFRNSLKVKTGLAGDNAVTRALGVETLGADTTAYGDVKGDKGKTLIEAIRDKDTEALGKYGTSALKNFLSPANIQKVDLSAIDQQKLEEYERRVKAGENPEDLAYLFPKKQYKRNFTVGDKDIKMSSKDVSEYNKAKATGGEEGMRYILENIMFNRYDYDSKGNKVPSTEAYTKEEKEALMKQFEGKSMREVEEWLYAQPEFKNASEAEKQKAIRGLWTYYGSGKAHASRRAGEQAVIKNQGGDVNEYNFENEITDKKREALQPYIDAGVLTYEEAVDFARNGGKTYYYENDEGGSSQTYYNKKEMIEYLVSKGYSYEKAEALFNSFKSAKAKPYSGNSLSSGRGGRSYGGHRSRGGSSRKAKVPKINAKSMAAATRSAKGTKVKLEPPKPKTTKVTTKFKKYEV